MSIVSWLYQFRGLSKMWVAILIPLTWGVLLAVSFAQSFGYNDAVAGFVGGVIIGAVTLPIVLSAKQRSSEREDKRTTDNGR